MTCQYGRTVCERCGHGPCTDRRERDRVIGERRHPDFDEHWRLYLQYLRQLGQDVPNRLYGAAINSEGDAI